MKQELMKLKKFREKLETLKTKKQIAYEEFLKNNEKLLMDIEESIGQINETTEKIGITALDLYIKTGNKKLDYGVGIRVMKKLEYDETLAFSWAKNHSLALSLDRKAFEKIAKIDPIDFVEIKEVPQVTIPMNIDITETI